jgi:S-DNA-T family DNA segregation ATPase FtsK/SpoIIIE
VATRKSAPKKTAKKGSSRKGRGRASRKKGASPLARAGQVMSGAFTREAVGVFLLALGLFYSAAFVSGRGAFLGDAGSWVVTQLFGLPGLALAR